MKKTLLLILLIPFSVFANYFDGTINFNNGTTKSGLIELPSNLGEQSLKFKPDVKAKPESFEINDIKGFEISEKEATPTKFVALYLAKGALFGPKECKIDKKKSWVRIEKEGEITLYSGYISARPARKMGAVTTSGWPAQTYFYLGRPDKEHATFFWLYMESGAGISAINNYKVIQRLTKAHFESDCPTLESFVDIDDFKTIGITRIVSLYDEHCGTK